MRKPLSRGKRYILAVCIVYVALMNCQTNKSLTFSLHCQLDCNNGNPTVVRIYQLKGQDAFKMTSPQLIWLSDDRTGLGNDYITDQEFLIWPGEARLLTVELKDDAAFIGVAANFYEPVADRWYYIERVEEFKRNKLIISIRGTELIVD